MLLMQTDPLSILFSPRPHLDLSRPSSNDEHTQAHQYLSPAGALAWLLPLESYQYSLDITCVT